MVPQPSNGLPGQKYFLTLLRDDLQIRLGECVYLTPIDKSIQCLGKVRIRQRYKDLVQVDKKELDIFSVERLWKDEK